MANGSKRSWPWAPAAAAVVSLLMIEPRNMPCCQENASFTSGAVVARRPPKRKAEIGTPFGSSHSGAITGHCRAGTVKREFGCAALRPLCGVHGRRSQSISAGGGGSLIPSHQTSPSGVIAQFVKMAFFAERAQGVRVALHAGARRHAEETRPRD